MKSKFVVIDDEPLARKRIQSHASKIESLEEVGSFGNSVEALNFLKKNKVDLAFLDIQMPELSGLDFIKLLRQPPTIVLTTAYREFAAEAYDLDVLDYLVKPISFDRFSKIVEKYYQSWGSATEPREVGTDAVIQLKADRKIFPVSVSTILYVESLDNYVKVHLSDRIIITHENISSFEERLPHDHFIRIHRSYLVNRQHVQSFSSESVFINNAELAFGRAFKHLAYRKLCKAI